MPYITREDGEHFVIPSYRDVLTVKNKSQLKKDILMLSHNYGEYITLQKKGLMQYEVAFSPDTGYLLGESIWQYFKKPTDLIYCEAIPNTTEALLVIVKSGSVYLDGSFPLDSIPEELIIFLTQENNFEIYTYGDVPITEIPQEGKFNFDPKSIKLFKVLDKPIFPTLPLLKTYQLQLVDTVLKAQGIGVFPIGQLISLLILAGFGYLAYWYFTAEHVPVYVAEEKKENPYQAYNKALASPVPADQIDKILQNLVVLNSIPGWRVRNLDYAAGSVNVGMESEGGKTKDLYVWAHDNQYSIDLQQDGIYLGKGLDVPSRPIPTKIYPLKQVIATLVDRFSTIYPGNVLTLSKTTPKGVFNSTIIEIRLNNVSPMIFALIGNQFKDLPAVLQSMSFTSNTDGSLTGRLTVEIFGS